RLLMMPRGEIRRHRDADSWSDLRVDVEVRYGVVEAVSDGDQLIRVDTVHHDRRRAILMRQTLELLRERAAERKHEAVERDFVGLRGFEHVDAALIGGTNVIDLQRPIQVDLLRTVLLRRA